MSLFKPSNLSPNFESVTNGKPLTITFQVNSNGSTVNAYRVQILKDVNDKDNSEDNILGSIYGTFKKPLYNKDIGEIILEEETLKYNGIELEPNKDYRWTLRLYGEDKRESELVYNIVTTGVGAGNAIEAIDFSKDFVVESSNRNLLTNAFGAISNCDISLINEGIVLTSTGNVSTSKLASNFIHFEVGTYTISGQVTQSDGKNGGFSIYDSNGNFIINNSGKGFPPTTFTIETAGNYYVGLYINYNSDKDVIATFKNLQIEKGSTVTEYVPHLNATNYDDYGLIVSQEDITGVLNNLIYSFSNPYVTVTNINEFYKKIKNNNSKNFMILRSEIQNKTQQELNELLKNKIHPKMYFYQINIKKNGAKYEIYINADSAAFSFKYYRTRYDQIYNENLTYIGSGNLVGSTKQIMWCLGYNDSMKINSYARMAWRPSQYSYFQPFKFNTQTISIKGISNTTIRISADDIKKEYVKNLVNGNFYVLITNIKNPFDENSSGYNVEEDGNFGNVIDNARKIIDCSFSSSSNEYRLSISANETIPNKSTTPIYLTLLYIQEQKIIQVDKNAGGNGLTKISFEEAFDYNISMNTGENYKEFQYLHLGYVNNNFDYDRFYIDSVEEFDNSTGFSYIILQKSTTSITGDGSAADGSYITQTRLDKLLSSTDQAQVGYKIINYVGKTGEVTIYNKAKNLPTIQTFYYIYKRNNSDNTKYNKITSGWLGGKQSNFSNISTNVQSDENGDHVIFDRLYIQPNIGIKEDDYMPMKLSVYNKDYTKDIYLTNYYNRYWNNEWREINSNHSVINTLDDTMWQIICKNTEGELDSLYISDDNVQQPYALYEPQTQYKIYTNFVDSIPEGFFYSRYDKTIKFEIYDLNTYEEKEQIPYIVDNNIITYNGEKVDSIPYRDLYVKSVCQDYKLINRIISLDTVDRVSATDSSPARNFNGKQCFIGMAVNNYLKPYQIKKYDLVSPIKTFMAGSNTTGNSGYGIGYDIKIQPNVTYTVKVVGDNLGVGIGFFDLNGNFKEQNNSKTFTRTEEEWLLITIVPQDVTKEASYSKILLNDIDILNYREDNVTNYVTLKEYHFDVLTNRQKLVYSTEENYDGKYKLEFRGCNNNSTYYIKSYIEDNYGKLYTYQARIPIKYTETLSDTNINVTTMCEEQAIKVDFTPVRQIESSGSLIYNKPYADTNYNNKPLTFYEYDNNIVSIPSEFSYCVQFKLDSNMIDKNTRLKILEVNTDNGNKYNLYFDTEAYFKVATNDGNKFAINKTYAKFILSNRDLANNENITKDSDDIKILDSKISDLIIPTQFAYIISNTQEVNNNYIYIMPSKVSDIYIDDQTNFKNTVPESCIDKSDKNKDILKLIGKDTFFVESNNENYINTNRVALTKMRDLIFTMTVKYDSTTKKYKITKATIS